MDHLPKIKLPQLPFITREMMSWGNKATLELEVIMYSQQVLEFNLIGATRSSFFNFRFEVAGNQSRESFTFRVEDFPTFLTLSTQDSNSGANSEFASIYLRVNGDRVMKLAQGRPGLQSDVAWPQGLQENPIPGHGRFTTFTGNAPAAGSEASFAMGTRILMRVHAIIVTLTTDATVATRRLTVKIDSHFFDSPIFVAISETSHTASLALNYHLAHYGGINDAAQNNRVIVNLPDNVWMRWSDDIFTETTNIQAGDQFGAITVAGETFIVD